MKGIQSIRRLPFPDSVHPFAVFLQDPVRGMSNPHPGSVSPARQLRERMEEAIILQTVPDG